MGMVGLLLSIGFAVAFVSGLLGIGGAILLTPALLYAPPAFGVGALGMRTVAAITIVQVFFASLSGVLAHRRHGAVSRALVLWMGGAIAVSSLAGALLSGYASNILLEAVFAGLALVAAALMLIPRPNEDNVSPEAIRFSRGLAALVAMAVGLLAGLVGAGGAFILVPLEIYLLGIPTRIAIGSTLGIVLLSGLGGAAGKIATGQVPLLPAAALVVGALPGAQAGAWVGQRVRVGHLRLLLSALIALVGARMWYAILVRP